MYIVCASLIFIFLVRGDDTVKHYRIRRIDEGGYYIIRRATFHTLANLVQHYSHFTFVIFYFLHICGVVANNLASQERDPRINSHSYAPYAQTTSILLLQLQSLEHHRLISDLVTCYSIVHQLTALSFTDFFTFSNAPTRGHPFKLIVPVAKNDTQKYFFSSRIVPIWNSLHSKLFQHPI